MASRNEPRRSVVGRELVQEPDRRHEDEDGPRTRTSQSV
jgi:hypothetical protein